MSESSDLLHGRAVEPSPEQTRRKKAFSKIVPPYAMLFFDHLYSEYLALKPLITEPGVNEMLEALREKRVKCELTWSDIYTFDLTLVRARPLENLIRKAYDARAKYRSIAGQKEYDEYVASKPPNLPEILVDPKADPPQPEEIIERALRADLEYLLSKVYLYYAILPVRESLRDWLTNRAVIITLVAVLVIGLLIFSNLFLNLIVAIKGTPEKGFFGAVVPALNEMSVVLVTVLTVALAGIVGGCVSMLQRIQSAPSEGDALFNLAALTNGWKGIFLSPLYGGIFAALLFVLFAAGLLEGSAFPRISTPRRQIGPQASAARPTPSPSPSPSPSPASSPTQVGVRTTAATASPTPTSAESPVPSAAGNSQTQITPPSGASVDATPVETPRAVTPTPTPTATPTPTPTPSVGLQTPPVLGVQEFLKNTGPADGTSYALLIIWSFIAGFAERLVPDTLNRLVTKNQSIQGTNT